MNADQNDIEHLPVPYVVLDDSLTLVSASREAWRLFGVRTARSPECEQWHALTDALASKRELIALVGASTLRLRHTGSMDRFVWRDGERLFAVAVVVLPPASGSDQRYGVCFEDRTAQTLYDRERESARRYLEATLDSLPAGVTVTDADLRVTNMNRAETDFLTSVGKPDSLPDIVGRSAPDLYAMFPECAEAWIRTRSDVLRDGRSIEHAMTATATDGSIHRRACRIAPLRQAEDRIVGAIRVSEDITEQERMAAELRNAEAMAARFEAVQGVVTTLNHEINNALTTVLGNAEMLNALWEQTAPDARRAMLDDIIAHATRISEVTRRLRTLKDIRSERYLDDDKYGDDQLIAWQPDGARSRRPCVGGEES